MANTTEHFIEASQSNIKALQELAEQVHASAEAWTALQLASSRASATVGARHLEASLRARDPQEWLGLQTEFAKTWTETTARYGQQLYSLAAGAGLALSKTVEARLEESQGAFAETVEAVSKPSRRK